MYIITLLGWFLLLNHLLCINDSPVQKVGRNLLLIYRANRPLFRPVHTNSISWKQILMQIGGLIPTNARTLLKVIQIIVWRRSPLIILDWRFFQKRVESCHMRPLICNRSVKMLFSPHILLIEWLDSRSSTLLHIGLLLIFVTHISVDLLAGRGVTLVCILYIFALVIILTALGRSRMKQSLQWTFWRVSISFGRSDLNSINSTFTRRGSRNNLLLVKSFSLAHVGGQVRLSVIFLALFCLFAAILGKHCDLSLPRLLWALLRLQSSV